MGLIYYLSDDLNLLRDRMDEIIVQERRDSGNPFRQSRIFIPNRNLRRWLQLQLSRGKGASALLEYSFLETGLIELLRELDTSNEKTGFIDRDTLKFRIFHSLKNTLKSGEFDESDPILQYIHSTGTTGELDARNSILDHRCISLSEKIAGLFQDYEYHRNALIASWEEGHSVPLDIDEGELEWGEAFTRYVVSQKNIYRDIFTQINRMAPGKTRSLWQYARDVLDQTKCTKSDQGSIHLFALSRISRLHLSLVNRLSNYFDICIYLLQTGPLPGRVEQINDWDEIQFETSGPINSKGPSGNRTGDHWNRPVQEMIDLLRSLPEKGTWYYKSKKSTKPGPLPPAGILSVLQESLRNPGFQPSPDLIREALAQEKERPGLVVAGAPGAYREAESIYQSILYLIERDPDLSLNDIAILVPDMPAYRPALESVFERNRENDQLPPIPYNLTDFSAGETSSYASGVSALLKLVGSPLTRKEMFDLFTNPCFLATRGIDGDMVQVWLSWSDRLGVYRYFDSRHLEQSGLVDFPDPFTWKRALLRLWAGQMVPEPEEGDDPQVWNGLWPYTDMDTGDPENLSGFTRALFELYEDLTTLDGDGLERTGEQWATLLPGILKRHLKAPEDRYGESVVERTLDSAISRLSRLTPEPVSFVVIQHYLQASLKDIPGNRGSFLTDGVTISALQPMRPIPFRYIFVPGLTEGSFPGRHVSSYLDLRNAMRMRGDVNLPEGNRLLFLETILSASDGLYLLYTDQDLQKDRIYEPCSLVSELRNRMAELGFTRESGKGVPEALPSTIHLPLRLDDPESLLQEGDDRTGLFASYFLNDRRAAIDILEYRKTGSLPPREKKQFPPTETKGQGSSDSTPTRRVTILKLIEFLKNPFPTAFALRTGFQDDGFTDPALEEDEPFYSEYPFSYSIPMNSFHRALGEKMLDPEISMVSHFENQLMDRYRRFAGRSLVPSGAFANLDRKRLSQGWNSLLHLVDESSSDLPDGILRLGSGNRDGSLPTLQVIPPIRIGLPTGSGEILDIYIEGDTVPIRVDESNGVDFYHFATSRDLDNHTITAAPFISSLVTRMAGDGPLSTLPHFAMVFDKKKEKVHRFPLPGPASQEEARSLLVDLLSLLFTRDYFQLTAGMLLSESCRDHTIQGFKKGESIDEGNGILAGILLDLRNHPGSIFPDEATRFVAERLGLERLVRAPFGEVFSPSLHSFFQGVIAGYEQRNSKNRGKGDDQ